MFSGSLAADEEEAGVVFLGVLEVIVGYFMLHKGGRCIKMWTGDQLKSIFQS